MCEWLDLRSRHVRAMRALRLQARGFAKRRARLDEYEHYERPLSARSWKKLRLADDFFAYRFTEMTPSEVSRSLFVAAKMEVMNEGFWSRGALALRDLSTAMTGRQLSQALWAMGFMKWQDEALGRAVAVAVTKLAPEMKATHLSSCCQAFGRMRFRHVSLLQVLSQEAQRAVAEGKIAGKGLAMMAEAFADLDFYCMGFLKALDSWAETAGNAKLEVCLELFHSLSLLATMRQKASPWPSPVSSVPEAVSPVAVKHLAETLALKVKELEAPQLHTAALAMGKLRINDFQVIRAFQQEVLADLSSLHTPSLPPILESFALCFRALEGKDTLDPELLEEREAFLYRLTGRLARDLRLLRPQEASRLLQSIDHLGLLDPRLLHLATELVPERLSHWTSEELLKLLEAYSAAENSDSFMLPCLRRALVALEKPLSDLQMLRAAVSFSKLTNSPALASLLELREPNFESRSCQLATATVALRENLEHLAPERLSQWRSAAEPERYTADEVLLAFLALGDGAESFTERLIVY